jgi:dipeptidyl aminopeptidase/acylaminoacyl peptidase
MPRLVSLLAVLLVTAPVVAQGTKADYERSQSVRDRLGGKVFRDRVEPRWYTDGTFSYEVQLPDQKKELVLVDPAKATRAVVQPDDLKDKKPVLNPPTGPGAAGRRPRGLRANDSADGKWSVAVRDHNVILVHKESKEETPLTKDGSAADSYGRVLWAPDSKHFVVIKTKAGGDRKVTLVETSPRDQLQPKTSTYDYLKPGDPIPQAKPHLFDVAAKKEVPVSDDLFPNPWDVSYEHWTPDGKRFLFVYNQRGHTVMRVLSVDADTGKVTPIVNEECKTFFDYAHKLYLEYLDDTNELVWMSERDGWNHLYLIDASTGKVKNPITTGEWVVRRVDKVDAKTREVRFQACGLHPNQDPYHIHLAKVKLDGTGLTPLTEGDGTHTVRLTPDGNHFLDTYSRVDLPPTTELRRTADGKKVLTLETADVTRLEKAGWKPPERFVAKGRDGKTDIYGIIHRPTNFDPAKKYPVIEQIYAGPHGHHVPKAFNAIPRVMGVAELGFVVVQIDGMGTSWRSKAFHDVCWKNLGDSGFPDRIKWIQAAAAKYPQLDLSKGVGIYGGSAGGQSSTRAVLAFGDFYTVAVSDCGCHDNRMDKIWWNELWMSWPIGKHYEEQSNVTQAKNLKGKLMLTVGELDKNVDPASTMQVANALIRANKDFELIVFPGGGHGAGESPYGQRRRADFFVRHLLGVEPRAK